MLKFLLMKRSMTTKFHALQPWMDEILLEIKKEIKTDYLPKDGPFYKTHFGSRPINRLTTEEINAAFVKELLQGNEEMSEWVVNRWVFRHGDLYRHFAERLSKINDDFDAIQSLTIEQSESILAGGSETFDPKKIYFFSMLNSVVFPPAILERLRKQAEESQVRQEQEAIASQKEYDLAKAIERHEREMARVTEKYEQKLAGVLKKYTTDVEGLKKQVRSLQQKLNESASR